MQKHLKDLSRNHKLFLDTYVSQSFSNATLAYRKVNPHFSPKTAKEYAYQIMRSPVAKEYLAEKWKRLSEKTEMNEEFIVSRIVKTIKLCLQEECILNARGERVYRFDPNAAIKGLELAARISGLIDKKKELDKDQIIFNLALPLKKKEEEDDSTDIL